MARGVGVSLWSQSSGWSSIDRSLPYSLFIMYTCMYSIHFNHVRSILPRSINFFNNCFYLLQRKFGVCMTTAYTNLNVKKVFSLI